MPAETIWNRPPLPPRRFAPLPPVALTPQGPLRASVETDDCPALYDRFLRACLLRDKEAMGRLQAELTSLMARRESPSGPEIRALMAYHAVSLDKAVPLYFFSRARALSEGLGAGRALSPAACADALHMLLWLYNLTGRKALYALLGRMRAQMPDWTAACHVFAQTRPVGEPPPPGTHAFDCVQGEALAAALRIPALQALFEGGRKNETAFAAAWEKLMRHHGAAHGLFSADPFLAGASPSRGVGEETVRALYDTLGVLLWADGSARIGDLFEEIYHGPLRVLSKTQAANQLTPLPIRPQGAAPFAAHSFMASSDGGMLALSLMPGAVRWHIGGVPVSIEVETEYPYGETVQFTVRPREPVAFPLWLRVPAWAEGATLRAADGEARTLSAGHFAKMARTWRPGDRLTLTLPMPPRVLTGYHRTAWVRRGPLVYALDAADPAGWNVALNTDGGFDVVMDAGIPLLAGRFARAEAWKGKEGVPSDPPVAPAMTGEWETRTLRPYGTLAARIAQFPSGRLSPG